MKTHLGCSTTSDHLLLSFYYDELEVVNPLGSWRGKHKLGKQFYLLSLNLHVHVLGPLRCLIFFISFFFFTSAMFYWLLLNIHPAHRSSLKSIQLLAVGKCSDVKHYGIDSFLKPAIDEIKVLANEVSFFFE